MDAKTTTRQPKKKSIVTNLVLDSVLLLVFLTIYEAHATGMTIHEWGALALASVAVVHILLHWSWIIAFGKRFFQNIKGDIRLNYVVNILLFVALTSATFSGLMMSEAVLPTLGIRLAENRVWHFLHSLTADISLGLVALHMALHWRWIMTTVRRLLTGSAGSKASPRQKPAMSASAMDME